MLAECKATVKAALVAQGIPANRISSDLARADQFKAKPCAVLLVTADDNTFDGSLVGIRRIEGTRKVNRMRRRYRRVVRLGVAIVDRDEAACDAKAEALMSAMPRGFKDANGNHIGLAVARAAWTEDAGFLLDEVRAELVVNCTGGVYVSKEAPLIDKQTAVRIEVEPQPLI